MVSSEGSSGSILGWLGFRSARSSVVPDKAPRADEHGAGNVLHQGRRNRLDEIATFLLGHQLNVTPANLFSAHGVVSGSNPVLARKIAQHVAAGHAVSQEWLDETTTTDQATDKHDGIQQLMTRLETTLETFSTSTAAARSATSDYSGALERQVAELGQAQETGLILSSLADLAKAMLERTRKLEAEIRRSEDEASSLRRSLDKAKRDAEVDHLTGLPNRRAFEAVLEREYQEARATLDPLTLAFCDIDHFKRINDAHGHDTGDRVIRLVAELLATISNDYCHVARHGGEEFVLLFRGLGISEAHGKLDKLREQMAERRLVNRKNDEPLARSPFPLALQMFSIFAIPAQRSGQPTRRYTQPKKPAGIRSAGLRRKKMGNERSERSCCGQTGPGWDSLGISGQGGSLQNKA